MLYYEKKAKKEGFSQIIGVDEVGRGALAGPVVAAAVLLKKKKFKNRIYDSKVLSPSQRLRAYDEITKNSYYGIGVINEKIVDTLGIREATTRAIENAIGDLIKALSRIRLLSKKVFILADGDLRLSIPYPYRSTYALDKKSLSCASASIVAKVIRDKIMAIYDSVYSDYDFLKNKGYGTKRHIQAIEKCGISPIHRRTFRSIGTIDKE